MTNHIAKRRNGVKKKIDFKDSKHVFEKMTSEAANVIFKTLIKEAREGNMQATKILLDRMWGKVPQSEKDTPAQKFEPITGFTFIRPK